MFCALSQNHKHILKNNMCILYLIVEGSIIRWCKNRVCIGSLLPSLLNVSLLYFRAKPEFTSSSQNTIAFVCHQFVSEFVVMTCCLPLLNVSLPPLRDGPSPSPRQNLHVNSPTGSPVLLKPIVASIRHHFVSYVSSSCNWELVSLLNISPGISPDPHPHTTVFKKNLHINVINRFTSSSKSTVASIRHQLFP